MPREYVAEGPTVAEAVDAALEQLGVQQDAVMYEVVEEPRRPVFGVGAVKPAVVRVWLKHDPDTATQQDAKGNQGRVAQGAQRANVVGGDPPESIAERSAGASDEETLDAVADAATEVLREILLMYGIDADIEEYEGDDGEIILDVVGPDLAVLIGRHGKTLDGLQVLVSAATSKRLGFRHPVLVDVEGYRNRRRTKIEEIAERAAIRAAKGGSPVRLNPMSALERRVVHMILRDNPNVTTTSEGTEPERSVIVLPQKRA